MTDLKEIEQLIFDIKNLYDLFNECFYGKVRSDRQLVNLKKLLVDDFEVVLGLGFVENYLDVLRQTQTKQMTNMGIKNQHLEFQYRIKLLTSFRIKLKYNLCKKRYVAKIINDLMGTRIVVAELNQNIVGMGNLLYDLKRRNIISRYYIRRDGKYRAIHCYFQSNNKYFPWELQIWDVQDAPENYHEHFRHEAEKGE